MATKAAALVNAADYDNGGEHLIALAQPYRVEATIQGTAAILFNRFSVEDYSERQSSGKGSKKRKADRDPESQIWRLPNGEVGIPGLWLRGAIIKAAKFRPDPRSPRASAMELYKAGVLVTTEVASLGKGSWDYLDQARAVVQRQAVPRIRPAFAPGWSATFAIEVIVPEYIASSDLHDTLANAGRFFGIGDHRPTYGRFQVVRFDVLDD
jgi:hypothetical protein